MKKQIWFEGEKTYTIIFTEEDINVVLEALSRLSDGYLAEGNNKFDRVKTRIYFQMKE